MSTAILESVNGQEASASVETQAPEAPSVQPIDFHSFCERMGKALPWFTGLTGEQRSAAYAEYKDCEADVDDFAKDAEEIGAEEFCKGLPTVDGAPEAPTEEAPEFTTEDYKKALHAYTLAVVRSKEANYEISALAVDAVHVYLGTGAKTERSQAIAQLAFERMEADPESEYLFPPAGKDADKHRLACLKKERIAVNHDVQNGHVCRILFGTTAEKPVVTFQGTSKRGTKNGVMPWCVIKALSVLVERRNPNMERSDEWQVIPNVDAEVKELVQSLFAVAANPKARAERIKALAKDVRGIVVLSLEREVVKGNPTPALTEELERWKGKEKKAQTEKGDSRQPSDKGDSTDADGSTDAKAQGAPEKSDNGAVLHDVNRDAIKASTSPDDDALAAIKGIAASGELSTPVKAIIDRCVIDLMRHLHASK